MRLRHVVSAGLALFVCSPDVANAQASPSGFTTGYRYDLDHRLLGTISPDPDGAGPLHYAAVRNSYDPDGNLVKVETGQLADWQSEAIDPSAWTGFTLFMKVESVYDQAGRKIKSNVSSTEDVIYRVTQYSYDATGRRECTATRMNQTAFGTLPSSACALGTQGTGTNDFGPDRITRNVYDAAGQLLQVRKAVGTQLEQAYATYSYTPNGKQASVTDANSNKAAYGYDGFDRLVLWAFPNPTTINIASTTDFEQYGYDANGNRISLRKRDGRTLTYTYDALNRLTVKDVTGACVSGYACTTHPSWAVRDVYYGYDLRGLQTSARFDSASGSDAVINAYDGFGRLISSTTAMSGVSRTIGQAYDVDGNRTQVQHAQGNYFLYEYDALDRLVDIKQNGSVQVASTSYDPQGRRFQSARGAVLTTYGYDPVSRLASLGDDLAGTSADVTTTFGYNPASQIVSRVRTNDSYAYGGYVTATAAYGVNGLNQYTIVGASSLGYDSNGNLATNGGTTFTYDVENRLVSAVGALNTSMVYDPLGRLYQTSNGTVVRQFVYDGDERVVEYDGSTGALLRRYVHGDGDDDPLLWYEGTDLTVRRSLQADHAGSIVSAADASGALLAINSYDEYGVPGSDNVGAFQYTGQAYLPDLGMYYYKARIYSSRLGRFLQTDPVGYKDQVNLYAYVANDPINGFDPSGTKLEVTYHRVDPTGYISLARHTSIRFTPENQKAAARNPQFKNVDDNGKRYVVISAAPSLNTLTKEINRSTDTGRQEGAVGIDVPKGQTEEKFFNSMVESFNNYSDNLNYDLFPAKGTDGYNSNSFVSGIIQSAGGKPPEIKNVPVPGYDKPVPKPCLSKDASSC